MCDQCDALKQENERLENSADELLTERDHAEEAVGDLFFAVMGYLAEWSNVFGYGDAREVVEEHDNELRKKVADLEAKVLELQSCSVSMADLCYLYWSAYHAGHHDTVEGQYTDVFPVDRFDYHADAVAECIAGGDFKGQPQPLGWEQS